MLDFAKFREDMALLGQVFESGMTPPELLGIGWVYHLRFSLPHGLGVPLLACGLAGLVWLVLRRPREALILCSFPVAYYAVAGGGYMVFVRYVLPVVPFLCITAAVAVTGVSDRLARLLRAPSASVAAVLTVAVVWPSATSVVRFDWLMRQRDSRLVAGGWVLSNVPAGATIYQAGNLYGHLQLEESRPFRYRYWTWDRSQETFRDETGRARSDWPDWVVVHRSALPYSHLPDPVARELERSYGLVHVTRAADMEEPRNVYDVQDAFFAPYGGFVKVRRPGPNVFVYQRMTLE